MTHVPVTTFHIDPEILDHIHRGMNWKDEQHWIQWAWAALARADIVPAILDDYDPLFVEYLITLGGLGHLFERFHDVRTGSDSDDYTSINLDEISLEGLTGIAIGRYAERNRIYAPDMEFPESTEQVLHEAVLDRTLSVLRQLRKIAGVNRLFGALSVATISSEKLTAEIYGEPDYGEYQDDVLLMPPIGSDLSLDAFDPHLDLVYSTSVRADDGRAFEWLSES